MHFVSFLGGSWGGPHQRPKKLAKPEDWSERFPGPQKTGKFRGAILLQIPFVKSAFGVFWGGARGGDPSRGPKSEHNFRIRASALQDRKNIGKFKYDFELRLVHTIDCTCARYMSTIA